MAHYMYARSTPAGIVMAEDRGGPARGGRLWRVAPSLHWSGSHPRRRWWSGRHTCSRPSLELGRGHVSMRWELPLGHVVLLSGHGIW